MNAFIRSVRKVIGLKPREEGATMIEYGLMIALIAIVCFLAVTALGVSVQGVFTQMGGAF